MAGRQQRERRRPDDLRLPPWQASHPLARWLWRQNLHATLLQARHPMHSRLQGAAVWLCLHHRPLDEPRDQQRAATGTASRRVAGRTRAPSLLPPPLLSPLTLNTEKVRSEYAQVDKKLVHSAFGLARKTPVPTSRSATKQAAWSSNDKGGSPLCTAASRYATRITAPTVLRVANSVA
jgi:hypothetical protein